MYPPMYIIYERLIILSSQYPFYAKRISDLTLSVLDKEYLSKCVTASHMGISELLESSSRNVHVSCGYDLTHYKLLK